ncbi:MAG: ABC transporter substrate-binding protein [Firmicutes bacterium]|nr:ABC transporter substrate-binding protein [Bacillota bacterium]MBR6473602.1 ABC transporter substrate-binding protein [Bacillota bacterium]
MKKKIAVLVLSLLMVFTLAACGGGGNNGGTDITTNPVYDGEPVYGGEMTVGVTADLDSSLDPHVSSSSAATREVLFNVFEGLMKPDEDGNMQPALAESYSVNDAADKYTFVLRKGVKFHNGKDVTIDDVVYSLSRAAGLETGEPLVSDVAGIKSVKAKGDDTVVVKLSAPDSEFLAHITTAIIPRNIDPSKDVIGTGPYKYAGRKVQESITFEKFDEYWGEPAYLDKITIKVIDNAETLVMSLKSGAIDMAAHLVFSQVKELSDMNIFEGASNAVQALYLNNAVEPLTDERVRKALCYAIDKQAILDLAFDGHGALVGSSMFPAFKKYFDDELTNYYTYDPAKAKELLKEAGYENGFDLTITVPSNMQQHVDTAQVIVEQLQGVGINAKINQVEWATWLEETYKGRNFESTIVSFDAHGVAASDMLARFQADNGKNMINFSSGEYDRVYKNAISTTDDAAQTMLFKECEKILTEEAANVYIQDVASFVAMGSSFYGYEFYPLYVIDFAKIFKTA